MGNKHFNGKAWVECRASKKACKFTSITKAAIAAGNVSSSSSNACQGVPGGVSSSPKDKTTKTPGMNAVKKRNKWVEAEDLVKDKLDFLLAPHGLVVEQIGGSNSNDFDGLIKRDGVSIGGYEVKLIPSVAGVQTVLDVTGRVGSGSLYSTKQDGSFTRFSLAIANKADRFGYSAKSGAVDLVDDEHVKSHDVSGVPVSSCRKCQFLNSVSGSAFEAFEYKYDKGEVILFVGVPGDSQGSSKAVGGEAGVSSMKIIGISPESDEFRKFFVPVMVIRPKKSGSSGVPKGKVPTAMSALEGVGGSEMVPVGGKQKLMYTGDDLVLARKALASVDSSLWVNDLGEVRKLSSTNNLTFMLSLRLRDGVTEKDFTSDSDLVKLILDAEKNSKK